MRRCRICTDTLPPERYFNCIKCKPILQDESEWEGFGENYYWESVDKIKTIILAKTCSRCKISKPRAEYMITRTNGLYYMCKVCNTEHNKEKYAKSKNNKKRKGIDQGGSSPSV